MGVAPRGVSGTQRAAVSHSEGRTVGQVAVRQRDTSAPEVRAEQVDPSSWVGRFAPACAAPGASALPLRHPMSRPPKAADRLFADAVQSVIEAIEAKDPYTRGHSRRVGFYAGVIARALGLPEEDVQEITLGGQLHDVGKIGIPDSVLMKTTALAEDERRAIQQHPVIGEQIAAPLLKRHPTILSIVRWHHERFDGRGFPDGLSGSVIPLGPRIVAVADAFDAMTSARPYRPALPFAAAVRELVREAGRQFDPACVRAFVITISGLLRNERARHPASRLPHAPVRSVPAWFIAVVLIAVAGERRRATAAARAPPARRTGPFELSRRPRGPPQLGRRSVVRRPAHVDARLTTSPRLASVPAESTGPAPVSR